MAHPWWQTATIYQVYPRSFQDTTGDGVGDLQGVIKRLDYLAGTLGVDALWLSPFYPSPMADFGYDVMDFTDVDPLFGTLDDFDELLAAAHERGLKLLVDWVPNHTSDRHPWFIDSRSGRDAAKRDWYVWRDPKPDGSPPNNWLSLFGGSAWEFDEGSGQFYLHKFLREQPDLDWRNPAVQEAMFETVRFWLDRGVDGLRIDVAHYIAKDPQLRDNPPAPADHRHPFKDLGPYDEQLHVNDKGHPDAHGIMRDLRTLLDGYEPERYAVGEIHIADWTEWASYYGAELDELHQPFNFALIYSAWNALTVREHVAAVEAAVPDGAWPNYVLGNHDDTRLASRVGPAQARVAAMLLLTLRGTPTLYYGDELGLPEAVIAPEDQVDPHGLNVPGKGRDGCRTPMQWSEADTAGFSDAPAPWLPFTADHQTRNVAAQLEDPGSLLNLYRALLGLRREHAALHAGTYGAVDGVPDEVVAYIRSDGAQRFLVALNLSDQPASLTCPVSGRTVLTAKPSASRTVEAGDVIHLDAADGVIVQAGS